MVNRQFTKPSRYYFAVRSGQEWLVGEEPIAIVRSWSAVKRWFGKAWLLGFIGYEQGYHFMQPIRSSPLQEPKHDHVRLPNVYFGVFKKVKKVKYFEGPNQNTLPWQSSITQAQYRAAFKKIITHIAAGDIYQANFTYRLSAPFLGAPQDVFHSLYNQQPTAYAAFIQTPTFSVSSVSPELGLTITGKQVTTMPMKGSLPRSQSRAVLLHSEKNKAELDMIIDVHRNDLAHTAEPGSIRVVHRRRIQALPTIWQANAVIQSRLAKKYSALDVIETCFPFGSITGAPKLRAMEILHTLEPTRRNIYCGSIGWISPNGNTQINVAIRTAYAIRGQIYYHTGGGIVWDSTLADEYEEALLKTRVLF